VCVSLLYVIATGSTGSRARNELGLACLPVHPSSDVGYVDLHLTSLGAPVSIGADPGHGLPEQDPRTETCRAALPGQDRLSFREILRPPDVSVTISDNR
jgi:hypothetical protein